MKKLKVLPKRFSLAGTGAVKGEKEREGIIKPLLENGFQIEVMSKWCNRFLTFSSFFGHRQRKESRAAAEQADEKVLKSTMQGRNFDRALTDATKGLRVYLWKRCINIEVENTQFIENRKILYEGHEPITPLQRGLLAIGSAFMALKEPTRSDMVAALGETTGEPVLRELHRKMICDKIGKQILQERPMINTTTIDMENLRKLPHGTFGKEYTKFMDGCQISSDTRDPVRFVDHEELAYVMLRYRQIHDFTHLLTGFPSVTVPNEIAVKWFEMVHFRLPMTALAALVAPITLTERERQILVKKIIPWAFYAGYQSKLLLNVYFEKHFEKNIDELRKEINLIPSPISF